MGWWTWSDIELGDFLKPDFAGFFLKLDLAWTDTEGQDQGLVDKWDQRSLTKDWSRRTSLPRTRSWSSSRLWLWWTHPFNKSGIGERLSFRTPLKQKEAVILSPHFPSLSITFRPQIFAGKMIFSFFPISFGKQKGHGCECQLIILPCC